MSISSLLLVGLGGCGGGADGSTYTLEETAACFESEGIEASTAEDDLYGLGANGGEGGITVTLPENDVSIGFERTEGDAEDPQLFGGAFGLNEEMVKKGNTVAEWSKTPTDEERDQVESCLK